MLTKRHLKERAAAEPLPAAADLGGASGSTEQVAATSPAEGAAPEHAPGIAVVKIGNPENPNLLK